MPRPAMPANQRAAYAAELKTRKRDYRLVAEDGVASASELQRDYEAALERRRDLHGAAPSTVEALAYQLRGGFGVLRKESAQRRLFELDEKQVNDIVSRLSRERSGTLPWSENEITALLDIWKTGRR